ncbi:MAG: tripartite tricarboxylate transporter permease [Pseudolabrys sp.]
MDAFFSAVPLIFNGPVLGAIGLGTVIGLVFGTIPGLTFTMALSLALPLTFGMGTMPAIALLVATYIGGMTGGSVSAILINIPGTPSAAATALDGYPMRKNGRASLALSLAVLSSTFGGLISLLIMVVSVDFVSKLAIEFGPAEIFALVVFGMSTICGLAEKSLLRGTIGGVIGLMLMTIGLDEISGAPRLTFGTVTVEQGINLVVAMIGLFAVPHIITTFGAWRAGRQVQPNPDDVRVELPSLGLLKRTFWLAARCAGIGTVIGAIPGTGGPIAAFISYDHARRFSKDKARFGKGAEEGVIAPETANNAVTGGTFIPLLSLGIPGDPATAVILSGLLIHGLFPGPTLFSEHPTEVYGVYLSIILAYVVILFIQLVGIRFFVKILMVPPHLLTVAITVMCVIGAYAIRDSVFDVYTLAALGLMGYLLQRVNIPITPVVLGLVLGPILERNFRQAMILSEGHYDIFYKSPTAMAFFALAVIVVGLQAWGTMRAGARARQETARLPAREKEA